MLFPSRLLITISLAIMAVFIYLSYSFDKNWAVWAIPFLVMAAAVFSLAPQIDWWWYSRNPPDVDEPVKKIFYSQLPHYKYLSEEEKQKFRQRVALTMLGTEYIVPSQTEGRSVPEDLKALIAAHAVMITWKKEKYVMDTYEKVVVYARSFPSPYYPKMLHAAESNAEDGVVLLSTERMLQALMEPQTVFNTVLYEYAKVFRHHYKIPDLALSNDIWDIIQKIGNIDKATIEAHLGLPEPQIDAILMSYSVLFGERFKAIAPKLYEQIQGYLNAA